MTQLTGWHCLACNRFGQVADAEPPATCPRCGAAGSIRRIEHDHPPVRVAVGDVVSCRIVSTVETHLVGEVVDIEGGRVIVDARDGTGRYAVEPEQIEGSRRSARGE